MDTDTPTVMVRKLCVHYRATVCHVMSWGDQCEPIFAELGGGKKEDRRRNYREYVESAVREGPKNSPWEQVQEQVVFGGEEFVEKLRAQVTGNAREQGGAGRLAQVRPKLEEVIRNVEKVLARTLATPLKTKSRGARSTFNGPQRLFIDVWLYLNSFQIHDRVSVARAEVMKRAGW